MFFSLFIAACICVCVLCPTRTDALVKLPKGFVQCKQTDPKFKECVLRAGKLAVPELSRGQPKFGIPPIDPLRINTLYIDQGHGSVNIRLNFSNLDIFGLSKTILEKVVVEPSGPLVTVGLKTAVPVVLNGTYVIQGKVLVLPIRGNGHSRLVLDGFSATAVCHFKNVKKNNEIYWHLSDLDFNFNTTRLNILLENLFNGDKALGDNMNNFLNENWEILLDELRPAFRTALSTVFSDLIRRFFDHVPVNQVFPPQ